MSTVYLLGEKKSYYHQGSGQAQRLFQINDKMSPLKNLLQGLGKVKASSWSVLLRPKTEATEIKPNYLKRRRHMHTTGNENHKI